MKYYLVIIFTIIICIIFDLYNLKLYKNQKKYIHNEAIKLDNELFKLLVDLYKNLNICKTKINQLKNKLDNLILLNYYSIKDINEIYLSIYYILDIFDITTIWLQYTQVVAYKSYELIHINNIDNYDLCINQLDNIFDFIMISNKIRNININRKKYKYNFTKKVYNYKNKKTFL